ncbi:MAG: hypothetical protein M0P01_03485 [Treponema sp.]|nr:hypothetical protein [Treponema sp.]
MTNSSTIENIISKNDVKPGDILLYVLQEKPEFKEWTKENLLCNFGMLIDMLIIFAEDSMCTHAALAAQEPDGVVESTMPYVRYRSPIYTSGYHISVRRVPGEKDGSVILKYLPPVSKDTPKDNAPYAYSQAVLASLFCIFRRQGMSNPILRESMLLFLKLLLYPLAAWLDSILPAVQGKTTAYFCSQLVADCYDKAAVHDSPDFRLHCPDSGPVGDRLIDWLLEQKPDKKRLCAAAVKTETHVNLSLESPEIICAALSLLGKLNPEKSSTMETHLQAQVLQTGIQSTAYAQTLQTVRIQDADDTAVEILGLLMRILKPLGFNVSPDTLADDLLRFQAAFIMPCDLYSETSMLHIGEIIDGR